MTRREFVLLGVAIVSVSLLVGVIVGRRPKEGASVSSSGVLDVPAAVPPPLPAAARAEASTRAVATAPAPSPTAPALPSPIVKWSEVPAKDPLALADLLGLERMQAMGDAIASAGEGEYSRCARGVRVEGVKVWRAMFELWIEPTDGTGFVIREAVLTNADPAIAELEACFREAWVGKVAMVEGGPDAPMRITYPVVTGFATP